MKNTYQERLNACLKRIVSRLGGDVTPLERAFTRQFFATMPVADLEKLDPKTAAALALSAFAFAQVRKRGQPKIRIFTPNAAEHGYDHHRLVVELLNDDMSFLVDSLSSELARLGLVIHETIHPILQVVRNAKGQLEEVNSKGAAESLIHFELSPMPDGLDAKAVQARLEQVLAYIRAAVDDWKPMLAALAATEKAVRALIKTADASEVLAFLIWLQDKNFIFLGYADADDRLGICAVDPALAAPPDARTLLSISKSERKSPVHRPALMDVITLHSAALGVRQFIGLFASTVYYQSVSDIPVMRHKLGRIMEQSGLAPGSHDEKALKTLLEFLPRDEMFQTPEADLLDIGMSLLALESKPGTRLFVRRDAGQHFVSCMAFMPREYFSTSLRESIIERLCKAFGAEVESFTTQMTESTLARLYVVLRVHAAADVDVAALEADIARMTHLWSDSLHAALKSRFGEAQAEMLFRRYASAFPSGYIQRYSVKAAVFDIEKCEEALHKGALTVDLYRRKADPEALHLKLYNPGPEIALSDIIPVLENMGFRAIDEHPFFATPKDAGRVRLRDFKLTLPGAEVLAVEQIKPLFEEALLRIWRGEMENDRFNALVVAANLNWREVMLMRAYGRYLRQIGFAYGQAAIAQALMVHPAIAKHLVALFLVRFDPDAEEGDDRQSPLKERIRLLLCAGRKPDRRPHSAPIPAADSGYASHQLFSRSKAGTFVQTEERRRARYPEACAVCRDFCLWHAC